MNKVPGFMLLLRTLLLNEINSFYDAYVCHVGLQAIYVTESRLLHVEPDKQPYLTLLYGRTHD